MHPVYLHQNCMHFLITQSVTKRLIDYLLLIELVQPFSSSLISFWYFVDGNSFAIHVAFQPFPKEEISHGRLHWVRRFKSHLNVVDGHRFPPHMIYTGGEAFCAWRQVIFQHWQTFLYRELLTGFQFLRIDTCTFRIEQQL